MCQCSWSSPAFKWPCPALHRGTDGRGKHLTDRKGMSSNVIQINHAIISRLGAALQQPLIPAEWNLFFYSLREKFVKVFSFKRNGRPQAKVNPAAGQSQATRSRVRLVKRSDRTKKKGSDQPELLRATDFTSAIYIFFLINMLISLFKCSCKY